MALAADFSQIWLKARKEVFFIRNSAKAAFELQTHLQLKLEAIERGRPFRQPPMSLKKERKLELETSTDLHLEYRAARIHVIDEDLTKGCTGRNLVNCLEKVQVISTV